MARIQDLEIRVRMEAIYDGPRPVVIESPYAGETRLERAANELYAQRCLSDALDRGEAPFASHLLYPQVLDDATPAQRYQGIEANKAWIDAARYVAVYVDRGISGGMSEAIVYALKRGYSWELRTLDGAAAAEVDAMLAQAVTPEALFDDVRLVGQAGTSGNGYVTPHPDNVADMVRRDAGVEAEDHGTYVVDLPGPAPRPMARPDGPGSAWGSAAPPAPEAGA
jgi:hypothetical protein